MTSRLVRRKRARRRKTRDRMGDYTLTVKVSKKIVDRIDDIIALGYYSSRSEFVRDAIIFLIRKVQIRHREFTETLPHRFLEVDDD